MDPDDLAELDFYERYAVDRLEPFVGPLRLIDRQAQGGPPGMHDFEADLPHGVAAIEVTSEVEPRRLGLAFSAHERFGSFQAAGSALRWDIQFAPNARVSKVTDGQLRRLLRDMEAEGLHSASSLGTWGNPYTRRLRELRIESVYAWAPQDPGRRGTVIAHPGMYSGWGWDSPQLDAWLSDLLASEQGQGKVTKLGRAQHATERHLVIMIDPFSPAGIGVPVGLIDEPGTEATLLPSITPPDPLTSLWAMPTDRSWKGLRWDEHSGWAVLPPTAKPAMPA